MKALRKNRIDYRHIVCIGITLGFIVLGVFRFSNALGRLIESIRDVGTSSAYYFCELFELRLNVTPTVNELPKIPFFGSFNPSNSTLPTVSMPENWAAFKIKWAQYWKLWANKDRVYIGEYNYMGVEIENGVPAIVDKEIFDGVQIELAKNSKAPARHTADDDYLLTTRLFCGKCGAMMVAQAGTSATKGVVYRYYACARQKKHQCDKKMVSKTKLENFIVYKTMQMLQSESIIESLAEKLYELQFTESTLLPKLQEQLKQKEKEIENIVNAVQKGFATETLLKRLSELEEEKKGIEDSVAKEQLTAPVFTKEHFIMALHNFRKIDVTKQDGKRKIIDAFINSIYLYDDRMKIVYNANGKEEVVTLEDLESSTLFSSGAPDDNKTNSGVNPGVRFVFLYEIIQGEKLLQVLKATT